jgi:AcrR family transcriptional regulator
MRVRTDERRSAILSAATEIFREVGFERASMAMIADRVGGSKTTLYGYFPSKEELFWDAMVGAIKVDQGEKAMALLDPSDPDVSGVLNRFGQAYLPLFTTRDTMAVTRTAIAEALTNKALSTLLYQRGPRRILEAVADYLSHLKKKGAIRDTDPRLAAVHLKGLFDAGIVEPLLFGTKTEVKPTDAVRAAVDAFLRAYGRNSKRRFDT